MNCLRLCLIVLALSAGLGLWRAADRLRAEVAKARRALDAAAEGGKMYERLRRVGTN